MKPDLMEVLCCPLCRGDLVLAAKDLQGEEILSGELTCSKCQTVYPIQDGIPNLLPPDERD
ncbi:MAG: methytransferase partner Trm112 [Thermoplasmata archaeon]|nr:methytransferase partner Trm112 [Thermoplasmata archaeon]